MLGRRKKTDVLRGPDPDVSRLVMTPSIRQRIARERSLVPRTVRHPTLLATRARRAVSPTVAFLELNHDPGRSLLLVGSGRSGTTWLAEVLTAALHCRLVYEPLRVKSVAWAAPVQRGQYVRPGDEADPSVAQVIDRILTGRIRNQFTDKYNTVHFPVRRLVKEVRITNLLPWIVRRYPTTPVVYLMRHPVPTAWSVTALGWPEKLEEFLAQESLMQGPLEPFHDLIHEAATSGDKFHRVVLQWCLENFVPSQMLDGGRVHVAFYEDLVEDPWGELKRLRSYLQLFTATRWDLQMASVDSVTRPSQSRNRGTAESNRLDGWVSDVPAAQVERALSLVSGFGLDRIYANSTRPVIPVEHVLLGGTPPVDR